GRLAGRPAPPGPWPQAPERQGSVRPPASRRHRLAIRSRIGSSWGCLWLVLWKQANGVFQAPGFPARRGLRLRVHPGLTVGPAQQPVRFLIPLDDLPGRVPGQGAVQALRQVREDAARGRDVAFLDVGDRAAARADGFQEVAHVAADGRRDVAFQVAFVAVLGVFVEFHDDVAVDAFAPPDGREVVAVDAGLQGAAGAVEGGAAGVVGVGRRTRGAVRPDHLAFGEVEGGGLGVGDVRAAVAIDEDAAGRADAPRPAEVEHPAHHVEHVDAHVADDA